VRIGWIVVLVCSCAEHPAASTEPSAPACPLAITLRHDSAEERATRAQLQRLMRVHDLSPWCFTERVVIDQDAIPHSHPVLTLHTRHRRDDLLLLATFVHEQSHWYVAAHRPALAAAVAELRALAPGLPVGFPDGAESETSSYEHLVVIALEERGVSRVAGELAAHQVLAFWATDHYRTLYRFVLERRVEVWRVMRRHALVGP
jgi:hypothetical protein